MLLVTAPNQTPLQVERLPAENTSPLQVQLQEVNIAFRTSPIFVEDYLATSGNDIRTAIRAAWLANPNCTWFIYPAGSWNFVGPALTLADGFRNGVRHTGQNTELYRDVGGVATGQQIFFLRTETGATHGAGIQFDGFKFSLLNCLTSYFGYAIGILSASSCSCYDCEFFCTLTGGATTGRIRWGLGFFGGTGSDGGGRNNIVQRIRMTLSQIQLCSGPNDVDGILCTHIESTSNNDYIVSCVSSPGGNVRNVQIDNIVAHNVAGSGCVFLGSDGAGTGIGADNVENVTCTNVSVDGAKDPDLDFNIASIVLIDLGIRSANVAAANINTKLASTELQSRSVTIVSQADEVSSRAVSCSNLNLGIVTTNDPLEPLYIGGLNLDDLTLTNINVEGGRGIRIGDCDRVSLNNVNCKDGGLLVQAEARNLTRFCMSNGTVQRTSGFSSALQFVSTSNKSFGNVQLSNLIVQDNSGSGGLFLSTGAAAGTTKFSLANFCNTSGTTPNIATLAAIIRAVNTPGVIVITTLPVVVPAVLVGQVGYVLVAFAGTRLADLGLNEAVVACPQAQLVAAGAGGAYVNARMQAAGVAELAFVGPLAGGAVNFSFARAAA